MVKKKKKKEKKKKKKKKEKKKADFRADALCEFRVQSRWRHKAFS